MLRILKQYYPIRNIFFVIGEGLVIYSSVLLACLIVFGPESFVSRWLWLKIFLITFICQSCLYYNELYDLSVIDNFLELSLRLLQSLGFAAIILAGIYFIIPAAIIGKGVFIVSIAFVILLIVSWRFLYKLVLDRGFFNQKIILVGSGDLAHNVYNEITIRKDCGYSIGVIVTENNNEDNTFKEKINADIIYKNNYEGLCDMARDIGIKKIVVALQEKRGSFPTKELLRCRVDGIEVIEGNSFYEMLTGKLIVEHINPGWLIFSEGFEKSRARRFIKYTLDLILSIILLVILVPVIIITVVLIKIDSRGPVFFSQERVGKDKKLYKIYKFRSMVTDAEKQSGPTWADENDNRITRIGRFIRKWRIDEIPQLWNVLKGDMSFVGPRPERDFFVKKLEGIIPYYRERFTVKPGISGWAQVSYGYGASVKDAVEKLNYDLFYIKNLSTLMDLMIILRTIKTVLFGKGAR
ncbi:MAG: TIGR03013 family PEP-CTERM/XrtA system glycosyltransferase [Desulfobacterales bacterium]|nr:TIGR03013 family PEP-CTERM/XrtA system glycosyltransferase [Desulfobacterales bacterium]